MNSPSDPAKKAAPRITIMKIVRAVLIGVLAFYLLSFLQTYLTMRAIEIPQQQEIVDDEPVHHDKNGKRINQPDFEIMSGYDMAKEKQITTHAGCALAFQHHYKASCQKYMTEQKVFPPKVKQGDWGSGKTTAQCAAEVNAYWEPIIKDEQEKGGDHAAASWTRRSWGPDLKECQNYDNVRISKVIHEPAARLDDILKRLDQDGKITQADRDTINRDMPGVSAYPDDEYRTAYLNKAERFNRFADGAEKPFVEKPLQLSCDEINAELDKLRTAEKDDVAEQAKLRRGATITNGARWDELNKARIDRLWSFKRFTDGAKAASCQS